MKRFLFTLVVLVSSLNVFSKDFTYIVKAENKEELKANKLSIFKDLYKKYKCYDAHIKVFKIENNTYKIIFTIKEDKN